MDNQNFNNQNFNNSGFDQGNQNTNQGQFYGGTGTQDQYGYSSNNQGFQSYGDPNMNNANPNGNFNNGYSYGGNQANPYMTQNDVPVPKYSLWLTLAIVQMVVGCCCAGGIFTLVTGILTIVFDNNAKDAYKIGDMSTYESKIKAAMITNIIGWGSAVVVGILTFTGLFLQGLPEALSEMY